MALLEEFEQQGIWLFRYRSSIPLFILIIGAGLFFYTKYYSPDAFFYYSFRMQYELLCVLVSLFGLIIRIYTVGHTPKNTSGRNTKTQVAETLNSSGIYSIVRHPLYLGNFFMWLGPAMITGNLWFCIAFCLFYWIYYERIMFAEEQFLRNKFGDTYLNWSKDVPAFIPKMKNFRKSELPFNWKKIMIKEKNGLAAIFIIFTFMDVVGEMISGSQAYNYILIYLCTASILYYLLMRFLRSYTKFFQSVYK
ncbi:MAG: lipid A phosphate methyltransferase [Ignavibacteria bacterium GWF2_33_9]|nr:MAG: lipid A phosphate methyltransferase [Ignavibacteria bacterium GWF2_33_9]